MRSEPLQTFESARTSVTHEGAEPGQVDTDKTAASWRRCQDRYNLNPRSKNCPDILTENEFHRAVEPIQSLLARSQEALDSLSAIVRPLGYATLIEERLFREHFRDYWIIAVAPENGDRQGLLLAIDKEQHIVGADQHARTHFALSDRDLAAGLSVWSRFDRASSTCKWIKCGDDTPIQLNCSANTSLWHGIVTPPAGRLAGVSKSITSSLHTRPRLDILHSLPKTESKTSFRGGLTTAACRRVVDYIENNLNKSIHVEMLENTDRSIAEIALSVGFSDQSHFTRRFSRHVGVTPGVFRRALRVRYSN